ncbi:PIN domain-containing protein [Sulfurisphaera javensis]|uniref:PIN domain-containing protein n=1 Tax=Sulfurisphaera javensis TaxID=2049879 RepID=A0AAT9GVG9_9CREN
MKAVVDTNVLIFDYVEDSEFHKDAEKLLDSLEKWMIPTLVIHEFVWFLKKNKLDNHIDDVLSYIKNEKAEILDDNIHILRKGIDIILSEKLSLSHYNDVVILSHAIVNNLALASFDRDLIKIAKKYSVKTIS